MRSVTGVAPMYFSILLLPMCCAMPQVRSDLHMGLLNFLMTLGVMSLNVLTLLRSFLTSLPPMGLATSSCFAHTNTFSIAYNGAAWTTDESSRFFRDDAQQDLACSFNTAYEKPHQVRPVECDILVVFHLSGVMRTRHTSQSGGVQ